MRAQLINDAFGLSRMNEVNSLLPLKLSSFLSHDMEYMPWLVFLDSNNIKYYIDMLLTSELHGPMQSYLADLVEPIYNKLGWKEIENEPWLNKLESFFVLKLLNA